MPAPFRVESVHFNGGSVVGVADADIVVIVGPNNTGKSHALNEIAALLFRLHRGHDLPASRIVVDDVTISDRVTVDELQVWLRERRFTLSDQQHPERFRTPNAGDLAYRDMQNHWVEGAVGLGGLAGHLIKSLGCGDRLNLFGSPQRLELGTPPEHALHIIADDPGRLDTFNRAFRDAFRMNLILDAWGTTTRLRVSPDLTQADFQTATATGFPDEKTASDLSALQVVESQSDGVRSFAGILMTLLAAQYALVLLDEPEAFLHPPQARYLGRYLGRAQRDGQLFVATHSLDVLLGLIESAPERTTILRLTREAGLTSAAHLAPERLARIWKDPFLRFSRALDGLFHDAVIVCEGDTDSQFYGAVADALADEQPPTLDAMFTYAGSKARIPVIAGALDALGVPVRVIVDFDALNDLAGLRKLVESVGGEFAADMEADWTILNAGLSGHHRDATVGEANAAVGSILGADLDRTLTRHDRIAIDEALYPDTGWRAAKKSGLAAVPHGDATAAAERLLERLASSGVFVVPSGEVESFVRRVPGKGPRWAVDVVAGGHLGDASEAKSFVASVLASV